MTQHPSPTRRRAPRPDGHREAPRERPSTGALVRKYGGTSLATTQQVRRVAELVAEPWSQGRPVAVVVSARGGTTDELLRQAAAVSAARDGRETDQLLATGEVASAALLALALDGIGVPAVSLTGAQAGFAVTGPHTDGSIERVGAERVVRQSGREGRVVVVAGFQGIDAHGDVVTLGRGGSDTTAVALASALGAEDCEILTDVSGIHSADPHVVPDARVLPVIDMEVMAEMAAAGAHVLHPRAARLAEQRGIHLHVRGAFNDYPGTVVRRRDEAEAASEPMLAVTHEHGVEAGLSRLSIIGDRPERSACMARALGGLERAGIPAQPSATGARRVSVLVPSAHTCPAVRALHEQFELGIERPWAKATPEPDRKERSRALSA